MKRCALLLLLLLCLSPLTWAQQFTYPLPLSVQQALVGLYQSVQEGLPTQSEALKILNENDKQAYNILNDLNKATSNSEQATSGLRRSNAVVQSNNENSLRSISETQQQLKVYKRNMVAATSVSIVLGIALAVTSGILIYQAVK